jgi:alanine-glyoxylate transaminase / serine-glyoxylate transaminase / serine-pyruvate transaminase
VSSRPLLMIPGPIEVSPKVTAAAATPPPSHLAPALMDDFGRALRSMRHVWQASAASQPFILSGSGTLAMEMAVTNLLEGGQRAVVVNSGYFSDRMATMLERRGVLVSQVRCDVGDVPSLDQVATALDTERPHAVFATHVDTSTGVRVDAEGIAGLARERGILSIFDGVCATAGERFQMKDWGADIYLTASQKAIGLPAGLALFIASPKAMEARAALKQLPPLSLDFDQWAPIMTAYESGRPSYFATPATTLIQALGVGLDEILATNPEPAAAMTQRWAQHERSAKAFRAAWQVMGLQTVPRSPSIAANTLSAVYLPDQVGPELVGAVKQNGVVIAGGLHPAIRTRYFRVGHMGYVLNQPDALLRTIDAIAAGLETCGHGVNRVKAAQAASEVLEGAI